MTRGLSEARVAAERALAGTRAGRGGGVIVRGGTGSGLTHAVDEAARHAVRLGMTVARGRGRAAERPLAFGVAVELFADAGGGLGPAPDAIAAGDGELGVIRSTWERAHRAPGGLAVIVDDLQDVDASTLRLLAYGAARPSRWPVAIIASRRTGVACADMTAVRAIERAALVAEPERLDGDACSAIVRVHLPDASDAVCAACRSAAASNPGLLDAFAADLASRGSAPAERDLDRIDRLAGPRVAAVADERLSGVSAPARRLARSLAAMHDPVAIEQTAAAAGLSRDAAVGQLDALVGAGVIAATLPLALAAPILRPAIRSSRSLADLVRAQGPDAATVDSPRGPDPHVPRTRVSLTPSELRVADLAAQGKTTKEIAAARFVTPKTVEFHLRNVYRKLEIPSSRAELARALTPDTGPPSAPPS